MYTPPAFKMDDLARIHQAMREAPLATLVTVGPAGLVASALPLVLVENEGEHGVLYGHLAKANPQWNTPVSGEALAIFMGPDAYVTPSWYATKAATGKVVPTWNYRAVHARGPVEFFDDATRLREIVTRLTDVHEAARATPWHVADAPEDYIRAQLRGIVGVRLTIPCLEGKLKMSQNRPAEDRRGVSAGLAESDDPAAGVVAALVAEQDIR